jgi:hypothetical protein
LARGEGDDLGERLKVARRVIVPPAAIFAALVCSLFSPPALACAAHRARHLSFDRASARRHCC